jgi:hypothetical protein
MKKDAGKGQDVATRETQEWQQREAEYAASALLQTVQERLHVQRQAYAREWERHEKLAASLAAEPGALRNLATVAAAMETHTERPTARRNRRVEAAFEHQMTVMNGVKTLEDKNIMLGDRLSFDVPPYDVTWSFFLPVDARGTQAHGPGVDSNGHMSIDLIETYVDRPVAYGGWMRAGAGVGVWFKPKSTSTYVRVAPLVGYDYRWQDDSSLQVAHNFGELGVFVQRFISPGNFQTILDNRERLWDDGTGWYETHSGEDGGFWVPQNYFWADSNEWYLVWVWCNGGIDFATKTFFGSSRAFQFWTANLRWLVFEQWT